MKDIAKAEFKEKVFKWSEKIQVPLTGISFRKMKTKWASFSTTGRLTFDLKLLELAPELQDYVIVHELLHYHVPNHGRVWKSLMTVYLGDYKRLDGMLKKNADLDVKHLGSSFTSYHCQDTVVQNRKLCQRTAR